MIVVSILLAFGIDAWWDERKERAEEAEILAGLHREFTENRDALVQGGRLELVTDLELRERLARWPHVYLEALDDETFSRDLVFDLIIPYLTGQGVDMAAALVRGTMPPDPEGRPLWPVEVDRIDSDPGVRRQLLSDPEFKAIVSVRYAFWHHAGGEYRAALEAAEEILFLLERQG